jgi:hypothetical protein
MNERLRELMVQADYPAPELAPRAQKFAELIIRECAKVAFESDLTMAIGQWGADSAILKHFGVEE